MNCTNCGRKIPTGDAEILRYFSALYYCHVPAPILESVLDGEADALIECNAIRYQNVLDAGFKTHHARAATHSGYPLPAIQRIQIEEALTWHDKQTMAEEAEAWRKHEADPDQMRLIREMDRVNGLTVFHRSIALKTLSLMGLGYALQQVKAWKESAA